MVVINDNTNKWSYHNYIITNSPSIYHHQQSINISSPTVLTTSSFTGTPPSSSIMPTVVTKVVVVDGVITGACVIIVGGGWVDVVAAYQSFPAHLSLCRLLLAPIQWLPKQDVFLLAIWLPILPLFLSPLLSLTTQPFAFLSLLVS